MSLNSDVDLVIDAAKAFALANTVDDGQGGQRPMTEVEALSVAAVKLVKRYAAQGALVELPVLEAVAQKLLKRINAFVTVKVATEAALITSNEAAITAALNNTNPAE
jgi:hypothetical protein